MHTRLILQHLYRWSPGRARHGGRLRMLAARVSRRVQRHATGLTVGSVVFAVWLASHIYYFNLLLDLESNVDTARAQIDVAKEKRNHVQRNLTQLLRFHAAYERDVIKEVTSLRTANSPTNRPTPAEALARIDAVSEQYPQLLLNTSVRQFSDAVVTSEGDVAKRVADYNDAVNIYTNVLHQFPGNVFGRLLGFRDRDYFAPEDAAALQYREVTP